MNTAPATASGIGNPWRENPWATSEKMLTTGQVARLIGLDRTSVWRLIQSKKIPATQTIDATGAHWRVPRWWVDEQVARRRRIQPIRRPTEKK